MEIERKNALLARGRAALLRFAAPVISLAVLAGAVLELGAIDFRTVLAMVPRAPLFWLVFAITYCVPIAADFVIYHRIWRLPRAGLVPLTRKLVGNELVVGYIGDAYLYAWARRQGLVEAGAYRAVKDVAILSAVASNVTTLAVAAVAAPFMALLGLHVPLWAAAGSILAILTPPIVALCFGRKLFSLPRRDLVVAMAAHGARAVLTMLLTALLWHLALPGVALVWWVLFAALKLLLSRLPFVSNKDLVLAGVAVMLLGRHADVSALMTMIATLTISTHVLVSIGLSARDAADGALRRLRGRGRGPIVAVPGIAAA